MSVDNAAQLGYQLIASQNVSTPTFPRR